MLSCQPEYCFKLLLAASTCLLFSVAGVRAQSLDYILNVDDKANLETLAQHTANRIDHADREQPHEPGGRFCARVARYFFAARFTTR